MSKFRRLVRSPFVPLVVFLVASVVQAVFWTQRAGDRTMQVMSAWFIVPTTLFLLLVWWVALSPVRWRTRLAGLALLAVGGGAFAAAMRFEGFSGDFVPQFGPRWQASGEQRAADYFRKEQPAAPAAPPVVPVSLTVSADDWPQFRGPERDGIVRGVRIRRDWKQRPPRAVWRHPVGPAWSSFAVVDTHAFTQEQRGEDETVVCYDLETGRELWAHADPGRFSTPLGGVGPLATPTVVENRVYALGPTGRLNCLDAATGRLLWRTNILDDALVENTEWGMSGSPLVYDDVVVVNPGGTAEHDSGVAAYDRRSGKRLWAAGKYPASYAAPRLATLDGVRQILVFDGFGLGGYDAQTGRELWRSGEWTNQPRINVAEPIVRDDGAVMVSTGYGIGSSLWRIAPPPSPNEQWTCEPTDWKTSRQLKLKFNGAVQHGHYVYGLDEGILACFDLETGRRTWKGGRYGYGQVLLIEEEGLLLCTTEQGDVALVETNPKAFREVTRFSALTGKTWNVPVLVRGMLLVRNAEEAACYDLSPQPAVAGRDTSSGQID